MATHLLVDIINGVKLVILSAKQRHDWNTRMRYFIGGTLIVNITACTLYVSTILQQLQRVSVTPSIICLLHIICLAYLISRTLSLLLVSIGNTEVIANSVIILFIMDIDELLYDTMTVTNTNWVKSMTLEDEDSELVAQGVEGRLNRLEQKDKIQAQIIKVNRQNIELIMQHIPELKKLKVSAGIAQDEYSFVPQNNMTM